jgi:hypothetical protein
MERFSMTEPSRSKDRFTFHVSCAKERLERGESTQDELDSVIEQYKYALEYTVDRESQDDWKKDNLEYDLRTTDWILKKVRSSTSYAQNLYAAMCNNEFLKIEIENTPEKIVEILSSDQMQSWSCSWRHAGGIIADMLQEGDYIDWYCSGIRDRISEEKYDDADDELKKHFDIIKNYVAESVVTDEIREDLLKLGWKAIQDVD